MNIFAKQLKGKRLYWGKKVRIYCDGGYPIFRLFPRFHKIGYAPYWGIKGFWVNLWGRQIHFSFGEDKKGLYDKRID
jgi:hypothetical protein